MCKKLFAKEKKKKKTESQLCETGVGCSRPEMPAQLGGKACEKSGQKQKVCAHVGDPGGPTLAMPCSQHRGFGT